MKNTRSPLGSIDLHRTVRTDGAPSGVDVASAIAVGLCEESGFAGGSLTAWSYHARNSGTGSAGSGSGQRVLTATEKDFSKIVEQSSSPRGLE